MSKNLIIFFLNFMFVIGKRYNVVWGEKARTHAHSEKESRVETGAGLGEIDFCTVYNSIKLQLGNSMGLAVQSVEKYI